MNHFATVKVYLDTNILSRVTDMKLSDAQALAYARISEMPQLELVTSSKTKQEIEQTPNAARASILAFLYSRFANVPWSVAEYSGAINGAPLGMCTLNGNWVHPSIEKLSSIFDSDDAMHVFQATQAGCHYFLTLDEKTILSRVKVHEDLLVEICPYLKFRSPVELASELTSEA